MGAMTKATKRGLLALALGVLLYVLGAVLAIVLPHSLAMDAVASVLAVAGIGAALVGVVLVGYGLLRRA